MPEVLSYVCICVCAIIGWVLLYTKHAHYFHYLPSVPPNGGNRAVYHKPPLWEHHKCVARAPKFLICPGSQKDSRQPWPPIIPHTIHGTSLLKTLCVTGTSEMRTIPSYTYLKRWCARLISKLYIHTALYRGL